METPCPLRLNTADLLAAFSRGCETAPGLHANVHGSLQSRFKRLHLRWANLVWRLAGAAERPHRTLQLQRQSEVTATDVAAERLADLASVPAPDWHMKSMDPPRCLTLSSHFAL